MVERKLKLPGLYSCWKRDVDGPLNNYLYATMFLSLPMEVLDNTSFLSKDSALVMFDDECIVLTKKNDTYYHDSKICDKPLVIYKPLYSFGSVYAREVEEFLSEVPPGREKDNKSHQKYRFEEYEV